MIAQLKKKQSRVLVVDDEQAIGLMIRDVLSAKQIDCDVLCDPRDLEKQLRHQDYDVIISDICMPFVSGLDLLTYVRHHAPGTQFILVTGHRRSDWAQQALRRGAFDYIEKPFDVSSLYDTVHKALREKRAGQLQVDPRQLVDRYVNLVLDDRYCIRFASERFAILTGINPVNVYGLPIASILSWQSRGAVEGETPADVSLEELLGRMSTERTILAKLHCEQEQVLDVEIRIQPLDMPTGRSYFLRMVDLSPLRDNEQTTIEGSAAITRQVEHDQLTGLPNHITFQEQLKDLRTQCQREGRSLGVIVMDVRQFHRINETYGHGCGDDVLVQLGESIRRSLRLTDIVARYGGNQFGVILQDLQGQSLLQMTSRLCEKLEQVSLNVGEETIHAHLVAGVVECRSGFIESQSELLRRAEEALYYAKQNGTESVILWGSSLGTDKAFDGNHPDPVGASLGRDHRAADHLRAAYLEMTRSLIAAVEAKDPYTKNHSLNVADYVERLSRMMGLDERQVDIFRCAAALHDIGKIGIPDAILTKPGGLTDKEFALIKKHCDIGADILSQSNFFTEEVLIVRHHHERWDGFGYPDGLQGPDIPLGARLVNICDAVDCMLNVRAYKGGYNLERVLKELRANRGTQFDPELADLMVRFLKQKPQEIHYPIGVAESLVVS